MPTKLRVRIVHRPAKRQEVIRTANWILPQGVGVGSVEHQSEIQWNKFETMKYHDYPWLSYHDVMLMSSILKAERVELFRCWNTGGNTPHSNTKKTYSPETKLMPRAKGSLFQCLGFVATLKGLDAKPRNVSNMRCMRCLDLHEHWKGVNMCEWPLVVNLLI